MEEQLELAINAIAEFAAQLTNGNTETIASSLKNEDGTFNVAGLTPLKAKHAEHIQSLNDEKQKKFDDGDAKGFKRAMTKFERDVKDKFGITSDSRGLELVSEVVEANKEEPAKAPELTDEVVMKHPLYLLEQDKTKAAENKLDTAVQDVIDGYRLKETTDSVRDEAKAIILSLNPVLSENKAVAERQLNLLLDEIMKEKYQKVDGITLILDAEGNPKKNVHGHRVDFSEFIKEQTEMTFDLKQSQERSSTGADDNTPPKTKTALGMPETEADFRAQLREAMKNDMERGSELVKYAAEKGWT